MVVDLDKNGGGGEISLNLLIYFTVPIKTNLPQIINLNMKTKTIKPKKTLNSSE